MNPPPSIRVRYSLRASLYPILILLMLAYLQRDSPLSAVLFVASLLLVPLMFRPFLVVENGRARFVSLISDSIYRETELSTLHAQLSPMRWILRRADLRRLESYLGSHQQWKAPQPENAVSSVGGKEGDAL
jgi:hypothetical protein